MSTPGSKRILIVEEHSFLRRALRRWLETMFPECQVIEAANGQQAIVAAEASLPDVILLDIYSFDNMYCFFRFPQKKVRN